MGNIKAEVLHYLGISGDAPPELSKKIDDIYGELTATLKPRHVYRVYGLVNQSSGLRLDGTDVELNDSTSLKMLGSCQKAAVFICTLGVGFDALLRAKQARDMANAVILDACGSAYVEKGCDDVQSVISSAYSTDFLTDRFSPGYGNMPLSLQKSFCALLNGERSLGIHITDSYLINPSKTVTAVVGISNRPQPARVRGCEHCSMQKKCSLKKGGLSCGL